MLAVLSNFFVCLLEIVWCIFLDYVLYVLIDYVARRRLKTARCDSDRNSIWRLMCVILAFLSLPVYYFHHLPLFLWTMILATLMLTYQSTLKAEYLSAQSTFRNFAQIVERYRNRVLGAIGRPVANEESVGVFPQSPISPPRRFYVENPSQQRPAASITPFDVKHRFGVNDQQAYRRYEDQQFSNGSKSVHYEEQFNYVAPLSALSPAQRFLRKPLRPVSFDSSGYGSPTVASARITETPSPPPDFRRKTSPTSNFSTSTPVLQSAVHKANYRSES